MTTTFKNTIENDMLTVLETFPLSATHAKLTSDEDYYTQEEISTPLCQTRKLTCPERPSKKSSNLKYI